MEQPAVTATMRPEDRPANRPDAVGLRGTVIFNPAAGRRRKRMLIPVAQDILSRHGWTLRHERTIDAGDATRLAREAVERGDEVVVVAGGDGTVNEVVRVLSGTDTALGVLPTGTVNVWARESGLSSSPLGAARAMATGMEQRCDVGYVGDRPFLLMAGAGFDGAVTGMVGAGRRGLKKRLGALSYAVAAARLAPTYDGVEATLEMDHDTVRCPLLMLLASNTRLYGGVARLAPAARADDGLLDVVVFAGQRLWHGVPHLAAVLAGRRAGPAPLYYRTRHLRVTADGPLHVQVDGEYIGAARPVLTITVRPAALRVIVPHQAGAPLFTRPALALGTGPGTGTGTS